MPRPSREVRRSSLTSNSGSPKKRARALLLEGHDRPQDHAERRRADPAEVLEDRLAVVGAEELQRRPEVGEVEQRQVLVVAVAEDQRQDRGLGVVEVEDLARAAAARSDETLARTCAPDLPDRDRTSIGWPAAWNVQASDSQRSTTFGLAASPGAPIPDRSPLTSTAKTGTPSDDELPGDQLQRLGLAGARGAGDQPVAVDPRQRDLDPDVRQRPRRRAAASRG